MLGKADVYIDGTYKATIDLCYPSILHKEVIYSDLSIENGSHTIAIRVKGEKNPDATNTIVNIDAIDVIH